MGKQQGWVALIITLAIFAGVIINTFPLQLGLDLRGGSQLILQVQPIKDIPSVGIEEVESVKAVLEKRVNGLGVSESTLQTYGKDQLILELPGEQDPSVAANILGKTALLEFKAQKPGTEKIMDTLKRERIKLQNLRQFYDSQSQKEIITQNENFDSVLLNISKTLNVKVDSKDHLTQINELNKEVNVQIASLFEPSYLSGKDLITAGRRQESTQSSWEVTLSFNQVGATKFAELTKSIAGTPRLLGIVLDGESISEASVGSQFKAAGITGGAASISGSFTAEEARVLEVQLKGGALPLPIEIIQARTIGPTLGIENINRSLKSALSGLILVAFFMLLFYRIPGLVALISLLLYTLFNLTLYALIPVILTLPGIAGFILSIGMAVDANILIFERIKSELRAGNTLIRSIETGFSQAYSSIIDGHLTTLISCVALFMLGTGLVKGFAATLGIGVVLSLFSSLTCTKVILRFLMSYQSLRSPKYFLKTIEINQSLIN